MIKTIIILFVITAFLSLLEGKEHRTFWRVIAFGICCVLIALATFKEVGEDGDSIIYQTFFENYDSEEYGSTVEASFLYISRFCSQMGGSVQSVFFIYAFLAIMVMLLVLHKCSEYILLPLTIFISHFFILHNMVQIRVAVATAFFLLGLYLQYRDKRLWTCICYGIAVLFHTSALVSFGTLILSNKPLSTKWKVMLMAVVPLGYLFYFLSSISPDFSLDIPYIGDKIWAYQTLMDQDQFTEVLVFKNPTLLINIFVFYLLLCCQDTILPSAPYLPIMTKVMGVSLFCYFFFSFFPVIATRLYEFFSVVNIISFSLLVYLSSSCRTLLRIGVVFLSTITLFMDLYVYKYLSQSLL